MRKELMALAQKMQVLKKKDKEDYLTKMRNCAILLDPQNPQSIPLCPLEEGKGYKIDLIRSLYRKLEGEAYSQPNELSRRLATTEQLKQIKEKELRQKVIFEGVTAYCSSPAQERVLFEQHVRKTKWLANFICKSNQILDYNFR